ncbi:MAG: M48 family metallopeptidase [Parahaliea sp.]
MRESFPSENSRIPEGINASQANPLREFLALIVGVGLALVLSITVAVLGIEVLTPYIPFEWELKIQSPVELLAGQEGLNKPSEEASRALVQLGEALVASSMQVPIGEKQAAQQVPPEYFSFHLVHYSQPNAFATFGAVIAVTDALPQQVESENGLAMVLAHEIAHIQLRHPIAAASRSVVVQLMLAIVLGDNSNQLLSTGSILTLLNFNREMELAADQRALDILRVHYGHLIGADELFKVFSAREDGSAWLEFSRTHPNSERRLQNIREAMADMPAGEVRALPVALQTPLSTVADES